MVDLFNRDTEFSLIQQSNQKIEPPVIIDNISVSNIINNIKLNEIAEKLSNDELKTPCGDIIHRKNRKLILLILLTSVKKMISQILIMDDNISPEHEQFIFMLLSFLENDDQIINLTSKVIADKKFMKLLNLEKNIETFNNVKYEKINDNTEKILYIIQTNLLEIFSDKQSNTYSMTNIVYMLIIGFLIYYLLIKKE